MQKLKELLEMAKKSIKDLKLFEDEMSKLSDLSNLDEKFKEQEMNGSESLGR